MRPDLERGKKGGERDAELASIPLEKRTGPLVISDRTALPFCPREFDALWRKVRKEAGLRPTLWNRDLRAGALTEGAVTGASHDDLGKLAGHSGSKMVRENVLVSSNRVAEARARFRGLGNDKEPNG